MTYEEEINSILRDETIGLKVVVREIGKRADEEIEDLKIKVCKLGNFINDHNLECFSLCKDDCIYKTTYTKTKCPDCPREWMIDADQDS